MTGEGPTPPTGSAAPATDEPGESAGAVPEAYVIPRALAQATLDYLASQPYRDVFPLVRAFEALEPLDGKGAPSLE